MFLRITGLSASMGVKLLNHPRAADDFNREK